jgi:hypothetical protein
MYDPENDEGDWKYKYIQETENIYTLILCGKKEKWDFIILYTSKIWI